MELVQRHKRFHTMPPLHADAETKESASSNQGSDILCNGLNDCADDEEDVCQPKKPFATDPV